MVKWLGIMLIAAGTLRGLWTWKLRMRGRIRNLQELEEFYGQAGYTLEKEQRPLIPFFTEYTGGDLLAECLERVAAELQKNQCPSGLSLWRAVMEEYRERWDLSGEQWNCLLDSGRAFFGRDRRQLAERLREYKSRMAAYAKEERAAEGRKQRVFFSTGILGALMLVILLI